MSIDAAPDLSAISTAVPLRDLLEDWLVSLEAAGRSPATIKTYRAGVGSFLTWHEIEFPDAAPVIDRKVVELWLTDLRRRGRAPGTRRLWFSVLGLFTSWLADPDVAEIERDPLAKMKPPSGGEAKVKSLTDSEIDAMLRACKGTRFADRRDRALIQVLATTGLRASEVVSLTLDVVNMKDRVIVVTGKGSRERKVPILPETAEALTAYLRARRHHPHAHMSDKLWLGQVQHSSFGTQGLRSALGARAAAAGIAGFHPHRLRHSFASRLKRHGFTDDEVMALGGWRDPAVARLYTADTAAERAMDKARSNAGLGRFRK